VIIEAKTIGKGWPTPIREAVGQLYEYRYFKVCEPDAGLIFLANDEVPNEWVQYLEKDRGIGSMWPTGSGFGMSPLARKKLASTFHRALAFARRGVAVACVSPDCV